MKTIVFGACIVVGGFVAAFAIVMLGLIWAAEIFLKMEEYKPH